MTDAPAISDATPDDSPESRPGACACCADARTERQLAMLQELAEIGMQIARAVRDEALPRTERADDEDAAAPAPPSRFGDPGLVYSRIARAVRQTLALETRIADGIEKAKVERARAQVAAVRTAFEDRQDEVRGYVAHAIEAEAAERKTPDREVERLLDDLDERLDYGDYDDGLADAPIGDLVARICADLGVTPDWSLWEDQDWAIEHLKASALSEDIGAERWLHLYPPPAPPAEPPDPDAPNSS